VYITVRGTAWEKRLKRSRTVSSRVNTRFTPFWTADEGYCIDAIPPKLAASKLAERSSQVREPAEENRPYLHLKFECCSPSLHPQDVRHQVGRNIRTTGGLPSSATLFPVPVQPLTVRLAESTSALQIDGLSLAVRQRALLRRRDRHAGHLPAPPLFI